MPSPVRTLCALVALLASLLLLAAPAGAAKRSAPLIGTQALSVRGPLDQADIERRLAAVQAMRMKVVRVEVTWSAFEPDASGRLDARVVDTLDRTMATARRRGLRVMAIAVSSPCWASSAPAGVRGDCSTPAQREEASHFPPSDPGEYARFTSWLVARHAGGLAGLILWNEPDHRNELYWRGPDKIARYVALARAAYPRLKAAAPSVPVLAGAFVGTDGRWLQALYGAGIKGSYDAWALHFYDLTFFGLRQTRAVMRRNGDAKPAWLGETGWSSCSYRAVVDNGHQCVSRSGQARFTTDLIRGVRRAPWIKGVLLYTLQDQPRDDFGLLDQRGRRKPVGAAIRKELGRRRPAASRRLRIRLSTSRGLLRVTGTAPAAEVWTVEVRQRGFLRYRGFARLDRNGRLDHRTVPGVPTRGVSVTVRSPWYGQRVTRRR